MPSTGVLPWESLERLRSKMFFLGAVVLIPNAGILFYDIAQGTELRLPLGQVFVGTAWAAVLIGMLGLYPRLAEQRPRLARASAFFAGIGVVGYAVMAVVHLAAVAGLPESTVDSLTPVFLPAVLAGTLLAFPLFAVGGLLTGAYSRTVAILLGTPTLIFVANVLSGPSPESILGVVLALVFVYATIGYLLRTDSVAADRTPTTTDTSV